MRRAGRHFRGFHPSSVNEPVVFQSLAYLPIGAIHVSPLFAALGLEQEGLGKGPSRQSFEFHGQFLVDKA
jgi:hypothetical protein